MDQTQIREIIRRRAENFKIEDVEMTDAHAAEVAKLHEDLVKIDPNYSWVSIVGSGSEPGTLAVSYIPCTYSDYENIRVAFIKRWNEFQDLVETMEAEGLI